MAAVLQRLHQAQLLFGRHPGEDTRPVDGLRQFVCGQPGQLDAGQDCVPRRLRIEDADTAGDGTGGGGMVTGNHLHRDSSRLTGRHSGLGRIAGWIEHGLQTGHGEVATSQRPLIEPRRIEIVADTYGQHSKSLTS